MTQPTKFNMTRDINGFNGFGRPLTNVKYGVDLATNVAQNVCTVPSSYKKWLAIFAIDPGIRAFITLNDTAAAFSGTAGSVNSELNPMAWEVNGGDVINAITPDSNCYVGVSLYALSTQ